APPDENTISVNHFKCYKVKVTPGTPRFPKGVQALVTDQFIGNTGKRFDLRKPKHFCNPVDKNGEGEKNPNALLVCYQAKPSRGQPKAVRTSVFVNNQFGPESMTTIKASELCVPSVTPCARGGTHRRAAARSRPRAFDEARGAAAALLAR